MQYSDDGSEGEDGPIVFLPLIIYFIYSSKTISIQLYLSIYSVQSTQCTILNHSEVGYFFFPPDSTRGSLVNFHISGIEMSS